ncbi:MAG: DUF488 domain-containing protein [Acidobacteriota bacterium]|nr:DUF488 domain-containing protein [Acidobacteriota bacterium]
MKLHTIGFTQRSAEDFFEALMSASIDRLIDVRLNNVSQLAGYSKKDDLRYCLRSICRIDYHHELSLAPTKEMLDTYRAGKIEWTDYEAQFRAVLHERKVERTLNRELFAGTPVLLCSEFEAEHCHRRIVAEYLAKKWGGIEIVHL